MAEDYIKWLDSHVKEYELKSKTEVGHLYFFRDPYRPNHIDKAYFFAPADGIIVYQKIAKKGKCMLNIKGSCFKLKELMQDPDFNQDCLVIGIFMTFFDVHVNRSPLGGFLRFELLAPLKTKGIPLLLEENDIFRGKISKEKLDYLRTNQRVLNEFFLPSLNYKYYVVQIADTDVKVITPFSIYQNDFYFQNERFSMVRWGSQVDLIIPLDKRFEFKFIHKNTPIHVKAGVDRLVEIKKKRKIILRR
ncbi:MAG: phosphatidylserine decarboxylase [Nanoarchaeota archaeon]